MTEYVYRRYLYIDTDEIMAYATVMDGGEISDEVRTITRQSGGKIGAELGPKLIPFSLSIGLNSDRFSSKQFKIRQSAHVATDKVITGIKKDKKGSDINEEGIKEGMVIECDVFLEELRKVPVDDQVKPLNWREKRREAKDPRIVYAREYSIHQDILADALGIRTGAANAVLILALSPQWLLRPEEFSRRATIVGKVVGVRRDGEIAEDRGDGTLDFKRPDGSTQEVAEQHGSTQEVAEEHVGWWRKTFRKPSRHAHDVASRAILTMKPAISRPELTHATIRIAPIVIYK